MNTIWCTFIFICPKFLWYIFQNLFICKLYLRWYRTEISVIWSIVHIHWLDCYIRKFWRIRFVWCLIFAKWISSCSNYHCKNISKKNWWNTLLYNIHLLTYYTFINKHNQCTYNKQHNNCYCLIIIKTCICNHYTYKCNWKADKCSDNHWQNLSISCFSCCLTLSLYKEECAKCYIYKCKHECI